MPCVLVLAAGRGERFRASGGRGHKLAADLCGRPVLAWTLAAVRASGLPWHVERGPHPGMGDSIAAAVRATRQAGGWLVLPADLPLVLPQTLCMVAAALQRPHGGGLQVVRPGFGTVPGHPVGFSAAAREALLALSGDAGAVAVVREAAALGALETWATDDEGTVLDVDTPAALEAARALLARRLAAAKTCGTAAPGLD